VNIQARHVPITAWVKTPLWGGSWCSAVDQPLATALNSANPSGVRRQAELAPRLLADQGRNVAEYLAVLRDFFGAGTEWKLCVLDLRLDQIDGASGCLHSCMHCGELRVIPWKLACTACCTARLYNLVWRVSLRTLA
jgi:hypothetical protein